MSFQPYGVDSVAGWSLGNAVAGKSVRLTAVTNAAGDAVFNLAPAAFAAAPVVTTAVQTTNTNATEARVTALSATSCTVNVRQSPGIVILGISVLQVPQPLVGATVHLHAFVSGSQD